MDANKSSVVVAEFIVGGRFVMKLEGVVLFVAEKNERRRINWGERKEGCLSGHKLNITDGFTDEFNRQI
jgi:hypothetical protein